MPAREASPSTTTVPRPPAPDVAMETIPVGATRAVPTMRAPTRT